MRADPAADPSPAVAREARHGETRFLAVAADGRGSLLTIDAGLPGPPFVSLRRVRLETRAGGRAVVPSSPLIALSMNEADALEQLRGLVAVLQAAIGELTAGGARPGGVP